jgi:hypothetical protein
LALIPLIKPRAEAGIARVDARIAFFRLSSAHGCLNGAPGVILLHPGFAGPNAFFSSPGAPFARICAAAVRQAGSFAPTYARARTSLALARNEATRAA